MLFEFVGAAARQWGIIIIDLSFSRLLCTASASFLSIPISSHRSLGGLFNTNNKISISLLHCNYARFSMDDKHVQQQQQCNNLTVAASLADHFGVFFLLLFPRNRLPIIEPLPTSCLCFFSSPLLLSPDAEGHSHELSGHHLTSIANRYMAILFCSDGRLRPFKKKMKRIIESKSRSGRTTGMTRHV